VKVLFVGEGRHEVGNHNSHPKHCEARGVVPVLTRRVCRSVEGGVALRWPHVALLPLGVRKFDRKRATGFRAKVELAILLGALKYGCGGTVCVVDGDTGGDCLEAMVEGRDAALETLRAMGRRHFAVCGVAFKSIDAWVLAAPEAMATELGLRLEDVRPLLPRKPVEELSEQSEVENYQPKRILQAIARLADHEADTEFREGVVSRASIAVLEANCPRGFRPFAQALRDAFGGNN
jgi:hypothetical protein